MPDTIFLARVYCQICDMYALHIVTNTGDLVCLECRAAGREPTPPSNNPGKGDDHENP